MSGNGRAPVIPGNPTPATTRRARAARAAPAWSDGLHAADVAKHNSKSDCWVIINDHVFDVTDWLERHPGGDAIIFDYRGQDASAAYNAQHPRNLVFRTIPKNYKGELSISNPIFSTPSAPSTTGIPAPGRLSTQPTPATTTQATPATNTQPPALNVIKTYTPDTSLTTRNDPPGSSGFNFGSNAAPALPTPASATTQLMVTPASATTQLMATPATVPAGASDSDFPEDALDEETRKEEEAFAQHRADARAAAEAFRKKTDFKVKMVNGWTFNDGTFDPVPENKKTRSDVPYPSYVHHAFRAREGLSSLQLSRNSPISQCAMDIAVHHLWKCMPGDARRHLYLSSPNGPALWGPDETALQEIYKKMDNPAYHIPTEPDGEDQQYQLYVEIKKRPWVIWPLWVEDEWGSDWITVIWYSESTTEKPDRFDQVMFYSIIDPRRTSTADSNGRHGAIPGRLNRIADRLSAIWKKAGMIENNVKFKFVYSSPMPSDEATSGERTFAAIKVLINQVIDWCTSGKQFSLHTTITDQPRWVNPYQQRVEMAGINAWILMASSDFNARVTVEAMLPNTLTEVAVDGEKKFVRPYDLAGPFIEPAIAAPDYLLPPLSTYQRET
ncbi:hypothetical protein EKO27_g6006 [Xylaria grammica]|uniref:Cytochrome b5 heme-binding domain-containing protein n=1 Tax=Xylaria grammica TaxID=363999 RepID=A0A439D3W7_9PEZI|nr:hypothetical protein EKO27_g6006 [Xylaria grammica]